MAQHLPKACQKDVSELCSVLDIVFLQTIRLCRPRERFRIKTLHSRRRNLTVGTVTVARSTKQNGGRMAILFSTWVKIGDVAGPSLKKNLEGLLANSTSALRVECLKENGAEVFYIRDRNIFDYLWEKLDAYESQLRDMRTRARVALESEIRPFIQEENHDGKSLPLWKRIEQRILDHNSLNGGKPSFYNMNGLLLGNEETVDELASIPNGLTLSCLPRSAFIASVAFGFNQGQSLQPVHVGHSSGPMIDWPVAAQQQPPDALEIKQFYLNALRTSAGKNLLRLSSMVITPTPHLLEKGGELSDEHAAGFLMAAKEFIKERKKAKKPVSLLITTENKVSYQKLQNEMLGIARCLLNSNDNAVQNERLDPFRSPQGFDSVSKLWDEKYENKQEVVKNNKEVVKKLDFSETSDDES
ncbi:MAG: hypothetical protein ACJ8G3_21280 [Burkholderiaceae bacterium]